MIAYFVYNLNKYSGASQQALLLAKEMNTPVVIFNHEKKSKFSKSRINKNLELINLPNSRFLALVFMVYFIILRKIKIIHLHGFLKHGILLGFILRKKVILKTTLMDSDDFRTLYEKAKIKKLMSFLFNNIDINICLTKQLLHRNREYICQKKIRVIPNGVEIPELTLTVKENIFCCVGLVCERKGTYESIEFFLKNYLNLPASIMYVIGPLEGLNESNHRYVERCYSLIASYNAEDKVIFTGNLNKLEVQGYYKISKALLFFSKKEGMPNVVLEAMANNCLPITTGIDGVVKEILGCDLNDKLTLKSTDHVIDIDVIDHIVFSEAVLIRAKTNFYIQKICLKYKELYERMML